MNPLFATAFSLTACWMLKARQQRQRITLLARYLVHFRIEKNMEAVTQGYLRALGEPDAGRREQIWTLLGTPERELCAQVTRLAADFADADPAHTRVSKLPVWAPFATDLFPSFDMREALALHARGIRRAVDASAGASARDRAYTVSAELFLMQHTCHWFCKSKTVASARMRARHHTSYQQLLAGVTAQTRQEYLGLVGLRRRG